MRMVAALCMAFLAACAMPPKTANDFRTSKYAPLEFEADMPVADAFTLLMTEYSQCYQVNNSTMLPVAGTFIMSHESKTVEAQQLGTGAYQIAVKRKVNLSSWYERMIELRDVDGGATRVTVYQLPAFDANNKTTIERVLSGEDVSICEK